MKWTQLKKRLDEDGVDPEEREKIFKEYKDETELEYDLEKDYNEWVTYPGPDNNFASFGELGKKAQRKYEVFCGGFLYYHDVEFKKYPVGEGPDGKKYPNKNFEHYIYFKWLPEKKGKKDKVIVYVTKTPPEFNPDPPKPPPPPPPESND